MNAIADKPIILLVDDEEHIVELNKTILGDKQYSQYKVVTARNGGDAVAILETLKKNGGKISLIVTDRDMPDPDKNRPRMDGLQLSQKAKELFPDLPIVMATGGGGAINIQDHPAINAFLYKPYQLNQFTETIDSLLFGPGKSTAPIVPALKQDTPVGDFTAKEQDKERARRLATENAFRSQIF